MQNIRALLVIVSAIALLAVAALLTASVTIAFAGMLAIVSIGRTLAAKPKPVPVHAKARQSEMRVWNDGRGTIIDL